MRYSTFIILLVIVFTQTLLGQSLVLDYSLMYKDKKLSFPEFISTDTNSKQAYDAINTLIQLQNLKSKITKADSHLFEKFIDNKYYVNCDYEVYSNTKTLLSTVINAGYIRHYNFNAQNGKLIELPELVIDIHKLYSKRYEVLKNRIEKKLTEFSEESKRKNFEKFAYEKLNTAYYAMFYIKYKKLFLYTRQSNHELKRDFNIDAKSNIDWTIQYSFEEIEDNLNQYGFAVFSGEGNIKNKGKEFPSQFLFLKGKINGKYPITMAISIHCNPGVGCEIDESFYWYNKVGESLYFYGSKNENEFTLFVYDLEKRKDMEKFSFSEKDGTYIGTWQDLITKKTMDFEAKSYYE